MHCLYRGSTGEIDSFFNNWFTVSSTASTERRHNTPRLLNVRQAVFFYGRNKPATTDDRFVNNRRERTKTETKLQSGKVATNQPHLPWYQHTHVEKRREGNIMKCMELMMAHRGWRCTKTSRISHWVSSVMSVDCKSLPVSLLLRHRSMNPGKGLQVRVH